MSEKRDQLVDALKGYACFLVVFGHVIMGVRKAGINTPEISVWLEKFIWTYHVHLFMFLSGYVYHFMGEWNRRGSRFNFIKDKVINLAIPYFAFSIVYILINNVVGASNVNNASNLFDILTLWKKPIAQYWFIYDLLFLFIAFVFFGKWLKNWQITLVLFTIKVISAFFDVSLPEPIRAFVDYSLVFGIGTCLNKFYIDKWKKIYKFALIIFHVIIVTIILGLGLNNTIVVKSFISLIGIMSSIALISMLTKSGLVRKGLLSICSVSFPIYLLHTIFTAGFRIVLLKMNITIYWLHIIVGLVVGFLFPIIIALIAKKIDLINFFFYPSKMLKKWKRD